MPVCIGLSVIKRDVISPALFIALDKPDLFRFVLSFQTNQMHAEAFVFVPFFKPAFLFWVTWGEIAPPQVTGIIGVHLPSSEGIVPGLLIACNPRTEHLFAHLPGHFPECKLITGTGRENVHKMPDLLFGIVFS